MLKLLDGATIRRDTKSRIEMFLVYVDQALNDGKLAQPSPKWRSIMSKLEQFERGMKRNEKQNPEV